MRKLNWSWSGKWVVPALAVAGLMWSAEARAEGAPTRCPVPEGADPSLASVDATARLDYLHQTLDQQGHYAHNWKWWWFGIGSVTLASSVAFTIVGAATDSQADFVDGLIVSAFSVVTPVTALLFAPRAERDAESVDTLFAQTGNGRAGKCEVLARTEEIFLKTADEEAFNTSWLAYAAAILGNGAMFAIIAVEAATASDPHDQQEHWINALTNTGAGVILTLAQILTSPTGAVSGWHRYLKGDVKPKSGVAFAVSPLGVAPGLALSLRF